MGKKILRIVWTVLMFVNVAGLTAQNVPITLNQGWNWISYPKASVMAVDEALGGLTPAEGDIIKGQASFATYQNGQWQGTLTQLVPGQGYIYLSMDGTSKSFVFGGADVDASAIPEAALDGEFTVDANGTKVRFSPGNLQCRVNPYQENQTVVGKGTTTSNYVPYNTNATNSLCMMLFRAEELHAAGLVKGIIEGIAFQSNSQNRVFRESMQLWITATSQTQVPEANPYSIIMDYVYNGSLTQQEGWTSIDFMVPFEWDGQSNLLVMVYMGGNYGGVVGAATPWLCSNTDFQSSCYLYNNNSVTYQTSSNHYHNFNNLSKRPNTRFKGKGSATWRFATNQTDYIGAANANTSASYEGWFDLFGWATSGHAHGAVCCQPWSTSTSNNDYLPYGSQLNNLYDQTGEADWGCNSLSNGGNHPEQWRTLTLPEWTYLLNTRSTSSGKRYAKATVGGVTGMILLPDNWSTAYYSLSSTNSASANFSSNTITAAQWSTLEQHGAVFLPSAGWRSGTSYLGNTWGSYWTSSRANVDGSASTMDFSASQLLLSSAERSSGESVRLVCQTTPHIRTLSVTGVGSQASASGEVQTASGNVTERGFCWNTTGSPTVSNSKVTAGTGTGCFNAQITGLIPGTVYYVRSYAKIGSTYRYGNTLLVTTGAQTEGSSSGVFSVSASTKVAFSKGNLQYQGSTDTWRFAEKPWETIGAMNYLIAADYDGWIDLFGWGTSGWNPGNTYYHPWDYSSNVSQSLYGPSGMHDLTGAFENCDWGYNMILGGGYTPKQWRTLTKDEWNYVLNSRTTSSGIRYAKAKVNSVSGIILLPDDWNDSFYSLSNTNTASAGFTSNVISESAWNTLEVHGAVFLPFTGFRQGTTVDPPTSYGYYWTASCYSANEAHQLVFSGSFVIMDRNYRYYGYAVRLVRNVQ